MRKIDLMIVGAQKAGTTSLKNYLTEHPEILGHPQTEFAFFRDDKEYSQPYQHIFKKYFTEGNVLKARKTVAKNVRIYDNETAIQRLHQHNPNCILVFLIRNPVIRAYSSFTMEKTFGWIKEDYAKLVDILKTNDTSHHYYKLFIGLGLYSDHLAMLLKYFKRENILIYLFEDFQSNELKVCKDIYMKLGINPDFIPNFNKKYNVTKKARSQTFSNFILWLKKEQNPIKKLFKTILPYKTFTKLGDKISELNKSETSYNDQPIELAKFLYEYFEPYNKKFEELSGVNLDAWKMSF